MKKTFDIFFDEDKELFYCYLDEEDSILITSQFFVDILLEIAKIYDHAIVCTPKYVYSESEYLAVLEYVLGITINTHFDY